MSHLVNYKRLVPASRSALAIGGLDSIRPKAAKPNIGASRNLISRSSRAHLRSWRWMPAPLFNPILDGDTPECGSFEITKQAIV